jgi:tripartite-type tricarboxylate transporter receptor subunit TctC
MLALAAHSAAAQDYPSRPVHLVVAFAAGGTTDFAARLIAEKAGTLLGQGIIVDNKPGANGALAAETVARAAPDGYTLFFSTVGAIAINPNLRSSLGYDVQKDFDPVAMLVRNTILLAVPANSEIKDFAGFLARAKADKPVTVGVTGIGATTHLSVELLQKAAQVKFQIVPYRGASQALNDLIGGQIDAMFGEIPVLLGPVAGRQVRILATTSKERTEVMPDVHTLGELGVPGVVVENWAGVLTPAGTPQPIIDKLSSALTGAVGDRQLLDRLRTAGVTPSLAPTEEFRAIIRSETERWGQVIRDNRITAE